MVMDMNHDRGILPQRCAAAAENVLLDMPLTFFCTAPARTLLCKAQTLKIFPWSQALPISDILQPKSQYNRIHGSNALSNA